MEAESRRAGFEDVDRSADPQFFVRYLAQVSAAEEIQRVKQQTYAALNLQPGQKALDVGCGLGDDVRAMARLVGPQGQAVGVDSSQVMIAEARARSEGLNVPVEFQVALAEKLPFPDNYFDGCRAERLLVLVKDAGAALAEMVRVLKPGGRLVVREADWEGLTVDAGDKSLTRRILNAFCDGFPQGWIGRKLHGMAQEAGLVEVQVQPLAHTITDLNIFRTMLLDPVINSARNAGVASEAELNGWLQDLEQRSQAGRFFASILTFNLVARKPG